MIKIVIKNLFFYWRKVLLLAGLVSFLLFLGFSSFLFVSKIKKSADAPLQSLQTEIILEQDQADKEASAVKTSGVIEPFNLASFPRQETVQKLLAIKGVSQVSSALLLWQFDIKNNRTIVGLDVNDPKVGLRKIEDLLMPGGRFFSNNDAPEVILERHFAKLFGYRLKGNYPINGQSYKIVGIVDFKEESNLSNAQVFMPYNSALHLAGKGEPVANQIYISLANASSLPRAQEEIKKAFPQFSVITKDRLLKNLSSFHRLVYRFGDYLATGVAFLALILVVWILKIGRMELGEQAKILRSMGWPQSRLRQWAAVEIGAIIVLSLLFCLVLLAIFYWGVLPRIKGEVLMDQNFKL